LVETPANHVSRKDAQVRDQPLARQKPVTTENYNLKSLFLILKQAMARV
jgi:hypothetical protein